MPGVEIISNFSPLKKIHKFDADQTPRKALIRIFIVYSWMYRETLNY